MKVRETKVSFLKTVNIGKRAYMITVCKDGFEADLEEIAGECSAYNACEIRGVEGTDPFDYKSCVSELCKLLKKYNPEVRIVIHTNGYTRPTGMNSLNDVVYVIKCKLKNSGVDYNLRVNENSWGWFAKQDSMFVFEMTSDEELDEINMLILDLQINKDKVYIPPSKSEAGDVEKTYYLIMHNGFNVFVEYGGEWFGRDK